MRTAPAYTLPPTPYDLTLNTLAAMIGTCFFLALLTDLAYWATANLMWTNFSSWLLFAGLLIGGVGAAFWIVGLFVNDAPARWWPSFLWLGVLLLGLLNSLIHAGDGWTGVMPWGLALSALTFCLMLAGGAGAILTTNRTPR
ncbi:hypothetical protein MLD63_07215 [Paracoccus sp. TK19116]|uniref:DUF2231 domain-containing protein n=1 Tax=Paracoccus albicereus TaxID=2922394 RepID=A0ABT1MPI7_9RHOB|nr:DUF2231 domain-containing protein [Paracoccus albicereus]MCQ0970208.1 hypothetical protein [Paracoccus albicereus]